MGKSPQPPFGKGGNSRGPAVPGMAHVWLIMKRTGTGFTKQISTRLGGLLAQKARGRSCEVGMARPKCLSLRPLRSWLPLGVGACLQKEF
jgi:hypothetical protein